MLLERTWRWFGAGDAISLSNLKQIGVEGVVTSLHQVKPGMVSPREKDLKKLIEQTGLRWCVVERLPVFVGNVKDHPVDIRRT